MATTEGLIVAQQDPLAALPRLPAFLERVIEVYEPTTEAHMPAVAVCTLTMVGCLIGRRALVRRPSGRLVKIGPACWNTLVAGPSGMGRKSTAADIATDALAAAANRVWDLQADEDDLAAKVDGEDDNSPRDPREQLFILGGGVGSSGESSLDDVAPPNTATRELWVRSGCPSTLLALEECGPLFAAQPRLSPHHASFRRFLLESYGGWQKGRRTKSWGATLSGPCAVSSIGTTTDSELLSSLSLEAASSGFLGRIVPVMVPETPDDRLHPFWEEPDAADVGALARWLVAAGGIERWELQITAEAEEAWKGWYVDVRRRMRERLAEVIDLNSSGAEIEATLMGRYQNLAQRMAVAATVADWEPAPWPYAPGREWRRSPPHRPRPLEITAATLLAMCEAVESFAGSFGVLVEGAAQRADVEDRYRQALFRYLRQHGPEVPLHLVSKNVRPSRLGLRGGQAQAAMIRSLMVQEGLIEVVTQQTGGRPGTVVRLLDS